MALHDLKRWTPSNLLTAERTRGEVAFTRNGTELDIWFRANGNLQWIAVNSDALNAFLHSGETTVVLWAESSGNAEIP